jgi:hypothetical protein
VTTGGLARRAARAAPVLLVALPIWGCVGKRERLDVPRVALEVDDGAPPAGGRVTGRATASDASGLLALAVYACSRDSVFRTSESYDRAGSAEIDFSLHVATNAFAGEPVEVYTIAYDDQGFTADSARVVFVAGGTGSQSEDAGLCARPRTSSSRVVRSTVTGP